MAPEQASGETLDQRSDLFSLGSVLYFMCTGRHAFAAPYPVAALKRVCEATPTPIRRLNSQIPDWLAAIVDKLMAKSPKDRFHSAAEVAKIFGENLARLQHSGPMPVQPIAPAKRRWIGIAAACVLGVSLLSLVAWMGVPVFSTRQSTRWPKDKPERGNKPPLPPNRDPNVLTVSQEPAGGGDFRTINEALAEVSGEKKTIRVLDDAVYEEILSIDRADHHRGITLEAVGKAMIKTPNDQGRSLLLMNVPDVAVRGLRFHGHDVGQIVVVGRCEGLLLDRLEMTGKEGSGACIELYGVEMPDAARPILIRETMFHRVGFAISVDGRNYRDGKADGDVSRPSGHVRFQNNTMKGCSQPIFLAGRLNRVQIVGNRILDTAFRAIDMVDFLPGSGDILIANNTILAPQEAAICIWDDKMKDKEFLKCKNIRIQNNLVLGPILKTDFCLRDHRRGDLAKKAPGDLASLLNSADWRFSHNWREGEEPNPASGENLFWIPPSKSNKLQKTIEVMSRAQGDLDFLRPAADSPLATGGVGDADPVLPLPRYVGAVPPKGMDPWDWGKKRGRLSSSY